MSHTRRSFLKSIGGGVATAVVPVGASGLTPTELCLEISMRTVQPTPAPFLVMRPRYTVTAKRGERELWVQDFGNDWDAALAYMMHRSNA
jgi:hypothetical protein